MSIRNKFISAAGNSLDQGGGENVWGYPLTLIENPNGTADTSSSFGQSMATNGTFVVVGASNQDDANVSSGKVYVFRCADGALVHTIDNPNSSGTTFSDFFGTQVAISDSYFAASATSEDYGGSSSGTVYVFNLYDGTLQWTLQDPNNYSTVDNDNFGSTIAMTDTYIAVTANGEDDASGTSSGCLYIFGMSDGLLDFTLANPNNYGTSANDNMSRNRALACNGTYIAAGVYEEDDATGSSTGVVYIVDPTTGLLDRTIVNPNATGTTNGDSFGYSVAMNSTYVLAGAINENVLAGNSGVAYLLDPSDGSVVHRFDNPNIYSTANSDNFGSMCALSENYALIGAAAEDSADGTSTGAVYLFSLADYSLVQSWENPNIYDTATSEQFGFSLALSDDYAFIGSPYIGPSTNSVGAVFQVKRSELELPMRVLDNPNATSTPTGDSFGFAVASSDSYTIVGAYQEDEVSSGSGTAYVFRNADGALLHTLSDPNSYGTAGNDRFGFAVDINETYCIVGAYGERGTGNLQNSGSVHVFDLTDGSVVWSKLNPNNYGTTDTDWFGATVAISPDNNYFAAAAYFEDEAGATNSGTVYIFGMSDGLLDHTLNNPNDYGTGDNDNFGRALSMGNTYLLVGTYNEDAAAGSSAGGAWLYNNSTGTLVHTFVDPNDDGSLALNYFGASVDLSPDETKCIISSHKSYYPSGGSGQAHVYSVPSGTLLFTLDNPNDYNTVNNDEFGNCCRMTNNYIAVAAQLEDSPAGSDSGVVYLFDINGNLLRTYRNPNVEPTSANDFFGQLDAMGLTDNYITVGAYSEEENIGAYSDSGVAYIFKTGHTHVPIHVLDNPNVYSTSASDFFGQSIASCNTFTIVGAHQEDSATYSGAGAAYIFRNSDGALIHTLTNPDDYVFTALDWFGFSVGICDEYSIVGAYQEDEAGVLSNSGKAYVFDNTDGTLLYTLDNPNTYGTAAEDQFGFSVDICSTHCIVGAPKEDDASYTSVGAAYVFGMSDGLLDYTLQEDYAATTTGDQFGYAVAITESYFAVGAPYDDPTVNEGVVYLYGTSDGLLDYTIRNPISSPTSDVFGASLSICETALAIGAYNSNSGGSVAIIDPTDGSTLHTIDNPNELTSSGGDNFGLRVGISENGKYLIVGAEGEEGDNYADAGRAYLYELGDSATLIASIPNPDVKPENVNDEFGWGVSISNDYISISARQEEEYDGTALRDGSGVAYIYHTNPTSYRNA